MKGQRKPLRCRTGYDSPDLRPVQCCLRYAAQAAEGHLREASRLAEFLDSVPWSFDSRCHRYQPKRGDDGEIPETVESTHPAFSRPTPLDLAEGKTQKFS